MTAFKNEMSKRSTEQQADVEEYMTCWEIDGYRKGIEQGREQGREQGQKDVLTNQLENRFGPLSIELKQSVFGLNQDQLKRLANDVFEFRSMSDIDGWLRKNT